MNDMFRATLYSSSGGQLYEYNFWYNHSVLVAKTCKEDSNKHIIEKIVRQVGYLPELCFILFYRLTLRLLQKCFVLRAL